MLKDIHIWLPSYIRSALRPRRKGRRGAPVSVLFALVDHFEPWQREGDSPGLMKERVETWIEGYETTYAGHRDFAGRPPVHTYFYPQEQYRPEVISLLAEHCARGFGEVEIHIHHDGDTPSGFVEKIETFKRQLRSHGLLPTDRETGEVMYGFVHGNWALDNSRRDGRWCGLDNEITLLRQTGCYADFTLPCAPADGQTKKINSVYFADDDPERPKSHDGGRDLVFGGRDSGDLLLIQGPLMLNWARRRKGMLPGIENGDVSLANPITEERIRLWIDAGVSVRGREDIVFVKVHTHGVKPKNTPALLGPPTSDGMSLLETRFNDGSDHRLFYVSAREMANVAFALNDGVERPVEELFDYRLVLERAVSRR